MPILNVHFINPYCKFIPDTYNNHENILTLKLWLRLVCFYLTTMKNTCNINFRHVKTIFCKAFNKILQLLLKYGHCVCQKMLHKKSQHTWAPVECRHYWAWWTLWAKRLPQPEDTPSSQSHWTQTWPHTSSRGWPGLLSSVSPASWGLHWLDSRPRLLGRWSRSNQCLMKSWLKTGKWWKKEVNCLNYM